MASSLPGEITGLYSMATASSDTLMGLADACRCGGAQICHSEPFNPANKTPPTTSG